MTEAATIAAKIRDHIANKTPARCNPTYLDFDDHWQRVRHWPDLGLANHSIGPRGKQSKVKAKTYWAHDLLPDTYQTLEGLLAALEQLHLKGSQPARKRRAKKSSLPSCSSAL